MTTLAQDAERLRQMADEVCAITARVRCRIQRQERGDPAFEIEGQIGGLVGGLRRGAVRLEWLRKELDK
jgi:hypothetical protein